MDLDILDRLLNDSRPVAELTRRDVESGGDFADLAEIAGYDAVDETSHATLTVRNFVSSRPEHEPVSEAVKVLLVRICDLIPKYY